MYIYIAAEFWFSELSYNVTESAGTINVCLELVKGTLTEDITIEIKNYESTTAICKDIQICSIVFSCCKPCLQMNMISLASEI